MSITRLNYSILLSAIVVLLLNPGCQTKVDNQDNVSILNEDAQIFHIDSITSIVTWIATSSTERFDGTINIKSGQIAVRNDSIIRGTIDIDLKTIRISDPLSDSAKFEKLNTFFLSNDFLNTNQYSSASFQFNRVMQFDSSLFDLKHDMDERSPVPFSLGEFILPNSNRVISGELELNGITQQVQVPALIDKSGKWKTIEARFNIDLRDWDLPIARESRSLNSMDSLIYSKVNIGFYLKTIP